MAGASVNKNSLLTNCFTRFNKGATDDTFSNTEAFEVIDGL